MADYVVDLKDLTRKVSLDGSFDPGTIDFGNENLRQTAPLKWRATAERAGEEIRIAGSLETVLEMTCSRCLEPASVGIEKSFDLFFRQGDEEMFDEDDDVALNEEDTQTAFFTGTELALGEILREQVLLALPMKALCRVDCQGLCPACGANRNLNTCGCSEEGYSPQMEKLLDIKRRLEERSS